MSVEDVRAMLELELTWRENELRMLKNQLAHIHDEQSQAQYRKALVVMLYSHFEGFAKTALSIYIGAINQEGLKCSDVTPSIVAATLADTFSEIENPFRKSPAFRAAAPDDTKLHRFARHVEFVEKLDGLWQRPVLISDSVLDTESNLTPTVLKKMLFRSGLDPAIVTPYEGDIRYLVDKRNGIAHGVERAGVEPDVYQRLEDKAHRVCSEIIAVLAHALANRAYRRPAASA